MPTPPDLSGLVFDAKQHPRIKLPAGPVWVFAYGSLMWRPDFEFIDDACARLFGYHRQLCLWSVCYRGTPRNPGLVLGLERGGSCNGRAFKIPHHNCSDVYDQLHEREMITGAYEAVFKPVHLSDGRIVDALTFIARPGHPQHSPDLGHGDIVKLVRQANGQFGSNRDYVLNTAKQLKAMGIHDRTLWHIAKQLN